MTMAPLRRPLAALLALALVLAQSSEALPQVVSVVRSANASPTVNALVAGAAPSATGLFSPLPVTMPLPLVSWTGAALTPLPSLRLTPAAQAAVKTPPGAALPTAALPAAFPSQSMTLGLARTSPLPATASGKGVPTAFESLHRTSTDLAKDSAERRAPSLLSRLFEASRRGAAGAEPVPLSGVQTAAPSGLRAGRTASAARAEPAPPSAEGPAPAKRGVVRQLWFWILVALAAGAGAGILAPTFPALGAAVSGAQAFGGLFISSLRHLAGPLVFSSVIGAIGGHEDPKQLGSLSWKMLLYFVLTSSVACGIGIGLATLLQPGRCFALPAAGAARAAAAAPPGLGAFLAGIVPSDPLTPFLTGNTLQIVFMAVLAGITVLALGMTRSERTRQAGRKIVQGAAAAQGLVMRVVQGIMFSAPLAVFGMTARLFSGAGISALAGMGAYVGTVLLGLALLLGFYCVLVKVCAARSPLAYLSSLRDAMLTGFSTASSSATMPVSLKAALKLGVSPPVANLMITMGAAVNMEGTALYQAVAVLFLAQAFGVALPPASLLYVLAVLLASSLGTPGAPGAGMAILATVMGGVGIPLEGIALIMGVDRVLDMSRTAINVVGDITSALMMDEWLKRK
ncbi:MAG: cation:dicarboxylase symporter family transporter [Elusimicrobiota bacterium]|jgi:Na+/H+-dicarboxylate symporter